MRLLLAILLLLFMPDWFHRGTRTGISPGTVMTVFFTPLHTYYMSPTGSDAANGLTPGTAWATPNHSVVCGDVIIVAAGTYNPGTWGFGTVSGCPSTTGGIDGAGGIYFAILLCGGADLEACKLTQPGASGAFNILVSNSNWALEGFKCDGTGSAGGHNTCFISDAQAVNRIIHHNAFINNIAFNTDQGFGINGCPGSCTHNIPGEGTDYVAIIGNIAQNAALSGVCLAAIDIVAPGVFDQAAGTHHYIYGNFTYNNGGGCGSDVEAIMFDTWDAHGAAYQGVVANNMSWLNNRYGWDGTYQFSHPGVSTWLIHNNTFYSNCHGSYNEFFCGGVQTSVSNFSLLVPYTVLIQNNIDQETLATQAGIGGNGAVYAMALSGVWTPNTTIGGTGTENIFKGVRTSCSAAACDPGFNVAENDGSTLGINIYVDPAFTNVADLISNRSGVPNCTGFTNVTACMGWNAKTSTLTTPSPISDLTATCAQCTGKGYQRPSITCSPNPEYPAYLKGIVYLRVSGANIIVDNDLVTKPCGM